MAWLNNEVFDQGLDWLQTYGKRVDHCSQEPATYTEATSTYTLGNAAVTTGAPQNGDVDGRKVTVPAVTGGSNTASGTATHVALSDGVSVLCATTALVTQKAVSSSDTFNLTAWDISQRQPS